MSRSQTEIQQMWCFRISVISYVLNANSGHYADVLVSYTPFIRVEYRQLTCQFLSRWSPDNFAYGNYRSNESELQWASFPTGNSSCQFHQSALNLKCTINNTPMWNQGGPHLTKIALRLSPLRRMSDTAICCLNWRVIIRRFCHSDHKYGDKIRG